jgi:hypothetical protein
VPIFIGRGALGEPMSPTTDCDPYRAPHSGESGD